MKHIIRTVLIGLLLCMLMPTEAQKQTVTTIRGHADFAAGEEIRLVIYPDLITFTPEVASSCKINQNGVFELSCNNREILLAQLEIRTAKAEFFVEPNRKYDFTINMDAEMFKQLNPQDYNSFLQINNNQNDPNDINNRINYFSTYFNYVFDRYSFQIIYNHDKASCDSVKQLLNSKFDIRYRPLDFYTSFMFYDASQLDEMYWQKDRDSLYNKYLNNDYILYNNPAYMDFFSAFYNDYPFVSQAIDLDRLMICINDSADYRMLFNEYGKDKFLVNERIRELVIIKSLGMLYLNYPEFDKDKILLFLNNIEKNSHFNEHKPIAENVINMVSKFSDQQLVADIKLKEANGKDFSLKKQKGNWVYLHFFRTDCIECIREMMIIKELNEKHKDSVTFVGVCLDFDKYKLQTFLNKYPQFDWKFVNFNQQYTWLSKLEVNSLPDYLLISPEGNIHERYLPSPASGLVEYLSRLMFHFEIDDDNPMFKTKKQ